MGKEISAVPSIPQDVMLLFLSVYERMRSMQWVGNFTRDLTVASMGLIFAATLSIGTRILSGPFTWIVFAATLGMITLLKWNQMLSLFLASLSGILLKLLWPM